MRGALGILFVGAAAAGCGSDGTTTIECGEGARGMLSAGAVEVTAGAGLDLRGAKIAAGTKTTLPASEVEIGCAADVALEGFVALGPAVTFGAEGTWSDRPFELTLPYKAARLPKNAGRRHVRIVAQRTGADGARGTPFFPAVTNREIDDDDRYASRISFRGGELTTYQVVAAADAGAEQTRDFGWNALVGISMGGNAAMSIALRHPDRFDLVADLGGEPGPSMVYSLGMVRDYLFGGFCTAEDQAAGRGNIGQLCPVQSVRKDQHEITGDFEHMISQSGNGVGLTLKRSLYLRASRDLGRALSNPALYTPAHPYAPPGVPPAFLEQPAAMRCANPVRLDRFYDREFNPAGTRPVITFCDGGDSAGLGLGVFDPALPQDDPAELLLAVDLDGNGRRDLGEPVITNAYEPFEDVGTDGVASAAEPGYDAVTNPDPARDDYHYLRNPLGTERNGVFDSGEPFEDVGLDGVAGTCQFGETPPAGASGCFDFGQGNGSWDLSPNVARWYDSDALVRMSKIAEAQRLKVALWFDAGIRDFLNASISTNQAVAGLMSEFHVPFGVYDGFGPLAGAGRSESSYDHFDVAWEDVPPNVYVRYGNPDASAADIALGDGRHVGSPNQLVARATSAFAWINHRWPEGERGNTLELGRFERSLTHTSPTTGRTSPFALFLPPGYDRPENAELRYPVVYFLHGYGQEPKDLIDLSAIFGNYMTEDQPLATRFQKMIIVYVDGRCRPEQDGVPVDPSGDRCEGGTFYMDAPLGGPARMETNLLELMDHIDRTYRTKRGSRVELVP